MVDKLRENIECHLQNNNKTVMKVKVQSKSAK